MVRSQMRPKSILVRLVEILESRKTEIPSAFALTDLIVSEGRHHRAALTAAVDAQLSGPQRGLLDDLLEKKEGTGDRELKVQRFRLTLLKNISQSTKPKKIKLTVEDSKTLEQLYRELQPLIHSLDLTHDGIRYYANSVIKSEIFQVSRRAVEDRYLHLICFIGHQFLRIQDTLVDILLTSVQNVINTCKREHKEKHYNDRVPHRQSLKAFLHCVDQGAFSPLAEIEAIAFRSDLADAQKIQLIQELLTDRKEERTAAVENLDHFKEQAHSPEDAVYYDILEAKSVKLQNRVADIVKHIDLEGEHRSPLVEAIRNYKQCGGAVNEAAPATFLSNHEQLLLVSDTGKFRVSLYKSLLFVKVADAIRSGALNLSVSYKYRSLDDYMISKPAWQADREGYLDRADLTAVANCGDILRAWAETLDMRYRQTNRHILDGENPHFHLHKDGTFHVTTPKLDEEDDEPVDELFPERRYISLSEVLATVNGLTHFLDEFQHWQVKYNRPKPPERTFLAGIIGYGCFIGTHKIARISKQINESELDNTVNWYFSLDNVHAANDRVLRFITELELPELYRKDPDVLHTSSDGQRYDISVDSLNANYSFKYHGNAKGVTAYNFLDERELSWDGNVISSGEKEAHYVIDGLMHNDVVKSDIHSTDTDGYSEVVFGVMHLLGFRFAPRLKNLKKRQLYSFPHQRRKDYAEQGFQVLPDGYINPRLIESNWDDILRFVATIKLKETTASQLFKRLNSYSKQHPLWQALKEWGKIPKSEFILTYIDVLDFRQSVEKQLNKGESSHKFSKAVSFGNNQEFLQGEKVEQEIAEGCKRLIKNAIICWNYLYATQVIARESCPQRRKALFEQFKRASMATWKHLNLHGEYDFSDDKLQDSVGLRVPITLGLQALENPEDEIAATSVD